MWYWNRSAVKGVRNSNCNAWNAKSIRIREYKNYGNEIELALALTRVIVPKMTPGQLYERVLYVNSLLNCTYIFSAGVIWRATLDVQLPNISGYYAWLFQKQILSQNSSCFCPKAWMCNKNASGLCHFYCLPLYQGSKSKTGCLRSPKNV